MLQVNHFCLHTLEVVSIPGTGCRASCPYGFINILTETWLILTNYNTNVWWDAYILLRIYLRCILCTSLMYSDATWELPFLVFEWVSLSRKWTCWLILRMWLIHLMAAVKLDGSALQDERLRCRRKETNRKKPRKNTMSWSVKVFVCMNMTLWAQTLSMYHHQYRAGPKASKHWRNPERCGPSALQRFTELFSAV